MHFTAYEFNLLFFKKDKMLKNLTLKCSEKWAVYKPTLSREPHNFDCNISSDFKGHVHPKKNPHADRKSVEVDLGFKTQKYHQKNKEKAKYEMAFLTARVSGSPGIPKLVKIWALKD